MEALRLELVDQIGSQTPGQLSRAETLRKAGYVAEYPHHAELVLAKFLQHVVVSAHYLDDAMYALVHGFHAQPIVTEPRMSAIQRALGEGPERQHPFR